MKRNKNNLLSTFVMLTMSFIGYAQTVTAQNTPANQKPPADLKTDTRILYHNGPILTGTQNIYLIWYGCWGNDCGFAGEPASQIVLADYISNLGSTPYFQINAGYPNSSGQAPTGALFFASASADRFYSHGVELTAEDIQGIVSDQVLSSGLPFDPSGIYLVLGSADVSSTATGFCVPSAQPLHGRGTVLGATFVYAYVGNPNRCPTVGGSQFIAADGSRLPTPNGNFAADAMASTMAALLDEIVTNPWGSGWFDRYGLENADKCAGTFGQTYTTPNGAMANIRLGQRDYLIQQNWVNDRKGHCAMSGGQ